MTNSSFSTKLPTLQLAIDSTSLGAFKVCPRYYQLSIGPQPEVGGFAPRMESVHLIFGLLAHSSLEHYHHFRSQSIPHEEALLQTVHWALRATWNSETNQPWTSDDPNKNRFTLIRTIVQYLDQYGDNDPIETVILANGKPAVELSFCFESGYNSKTTSEPFLICGHLDRLGTLNGKPWISDFKTTKQTINRRFFEKFTPFNQFTIYTLAGQVVWHIPALGVIVDGAQVAVTFSKFEREIVSRSTSQLDEWHRDLAYWLSYMEQCAIDNYWPKNDMSCDRYGGCPFRPVCSQRSPESESIFLHGNYVSRTWDPLLRRGDI